MLIPLWTLRVIGRNGAQEDLYPAVTISVRLLSDHHPCILRLPSEGTTPVDAIKLAGLSAEDWARRLGSIPDVLRWQDTFFFNFVQ